tara:strand:- start:137 stop:520 length:384 start_codon:yes stop_codon:yes gene_type:complete
MKKIMLMAIILGSQLFAQINEGTYYCNDIYSSLSEDQIVVYTEPVDGYVYLYIDPYGIRIKNKKSIGFYYPWIYVGTFVDYQTYLLDNGDKIVIAPEINGLYHFYDRQDDEKEYKKLTEYHNVQKKK